jgi:hypothetical protein
MSVSDHSREPEDDLDRLLRETLRDDLPADVEARLAGRLRAFLFSRRSARAPAGERPSGLLDSLLSPLVRRTPARVALAVAATLLLASGLGLQAAVAPDAVNEPLRRINLSVSVFRALQGVSSLRCAGMTDAALDSPDTLAASVYRRWVPVHTRAGAQGDVVASYRAADPAIGYELVLDGATLLPREVRRSGGREAPGGATCTWMPLPPSSGGEPR